MPAHVLVRPLLALAARALLVLRPTATFAAFRHLAPAACTPGSAIKVVLRLAPALEDVDQTELAR